MKYNNFEVDEDNNFIFYDDRVYISDENNFTRRKQIVIKGKNDWGDLLVEELYNIDSNSPCDYERNRKLLDENLDGLLSEVNNIYDALLNLCKYVDVPDGTFEYLFV